MIRTIWGDPERFKKSYFPEELKGYYLAGDGAVRSADRGYFRITGRIDDVLNVSGHRMGTMEIESALVAKSDLVAEAAVVGRPDDLTGEAIVAFVVLKRPVPTGDEAKALANELRNWVGKEIGPIAKPKEIRFGENLPKTRSGKIMRRLLRSLAKGETITQDTSTLENPAILEQLAKTDLVAEAAVVGRPDDVTGEAICAFVVLKRARPTGEEARQLATELRNWVAKEIGPIAKPRDIRFGDNLPKTRSGKIMRRLLRSLAKGEAITQDTTTLENPAILEQLAQTN